VLRLSSQDGELFRHPVKMWLFVYGSPVSIGVNPLSALKHYIEWGNEGEIGWRRNACLGFA